MKPRHTFVVAAIAAVAGMVVTAPAGAQTRVDTIEYAGPDRGLLRSGVWTLGLSYVPALIVGIESPVPEDRYLVAPVAGPWVDLGRRDCMTCPHETLNQVLLAADGVIQGVGTLEILGSFLFTEHAVVQRTARADTTPKLHFRLTPNVTAKTYTMTAFGTF